MYGDEHNKFRFCCSAIKTAWSAPARAAGRRV
jgi:hypothetical protein